MAAMRLHCVYISRGLTEPDGKFDELEEMERDMEKMERGKSELRMAMEELCLLSSRDVEDQKEQEQQQQQRSSTMDLLCVSKQLLHVLGWFSTQYLIRCKIFAVCSLFC
jgi:hypothetical protein